MIETLSHNQSPLAQARKARRTKLADVTPTVAAAAAVHAGSSASQSRVKGLSQANQTILSALLDSKCDYVHNQLFEESDAQTKVFDEAPEIRKPDTSWYHPVMDGLTPRVVRSTNPVTLVLTAEQERALFLQFNYCRYRVSELRIKIGDDKVTPAQAKDILHWHARAEAYRDQIAQTNLALVLAMAKRTRMSEVDFTDLVSEGNMALLRAVDKFDAARGFKFSTYGCRAILKAFSRAGIKLSKYRSMFPTDFDPKYEKSDYMDRKRESHENDCVEELRDIIGQNVADLTEIEKEVIEHRFAIGPEKKADPEASPMTLEQVGKIIGVTKERVRQIQNKALVKLRHSLEGGFLA